MIFLLALFLRTFNLSSVPAGFTPDEASFGYDAYSLLQTGKDQWGHTMPLVLESFGDFKPPLYSYILIPFVGIFGLSERVVRFPNALFGSLAVVVTYYLVIELFRKKKKGVRNCELGIIASLLLAISPWHVMMSRGGFEANLTTFLMPLGIYGFLRGIREIGKVRVKLLTISAFSFGLNLFSYHSARLVTPLIVLALLAFYHRQFFKLSKKYVVTYLGVVGIFGILMFYTFSIGAGARAADISIYGGSQEAAAGPRLEVINAGMNPTIAKFRHNRFLVTVERFIDNYQQYYSPKYLVLDGPAEATYGMIPGRGVLYPFSAVLIIGFLLALWKFRKYRGVWLIVFWVLVATVPSAMATGPGYAGNRSVIIIPALQIALALGAAVWYELLMSIKMVKNYKRILGILVGMVLIFCVGRFVNDYFVKAEVITAPAMLYGRREMVKYLTDNGYNPKFSSVVVDKRLSEPQMHVAFFSKTDPREYQEWTQNWEAYREKEVNFIDQLDEYKMGEYLFTTNFIEKTDRFTNKDLLVGKPEEFPKGVVPEYVIKYPSGEDAIYFVNPNTNVYAFELIN